MKKKRNSYTADFKLDVINKAQEVGNREAGRLFDVDEKCVRRWRSCKKELESMNRRKRSNRYRKPYWPLLEKDLYNWIKSQRDGGRPVSTIQIRLRAKSLAKIMNISNFAGNSSWCYRFMRRNKLSVRAKTTIGQQLPADWEAKVKDFVDYFTELRNTHKYELKHIVNMDEVPLAFDCPPNKTVETTNAASVSIVTTGHEKTHMTVVLACCADGTKLKPLIIFKRKTLPKEDFPPGIIIAQNEKGWMNQSIMLKWFEEVWRKRRDAFFDNKGLLILDSMRAHLEDSVKKYAAKSGAKLAVIPGGLTKKLQPLDVSVNRSFKSHVRSEWEKWMSLGLKQYTKSGNMKRASLSEVCRWVLKAWNAVTIQTVRSGFRKAGLVNYEEDDDLSENEEFLSEDEDMSNNELDPDILKLFQSDSEESDFDGF